MKTLPILRLYETRSVELELSVSALHNTALNYLIFFRRNFQATNLFRFKNVEMCVQQITTYMFCILNRQYNI